MENRLKYGLDRMLKYILLVLLVAGCSHARRDKSYLSDSGLDTADMRADSGNVVEPDFSYVLHEFNELYRAPVILNSTINTSEDTLQFMLKHFSLADTIVVPKKYNWGANKFDYVVRNVASRITITRNDEVLVDTTLTKEDFVHLLDDNLKSYGVLMFPAYQGYDSASRSVIVNYSVSIPCTDIGKLVNFKGVMEAGRSARSIK